MCFSVLCGASERNFVLEISNWHKTAGFPSGLWKTGFHTNDSQRSSCNRAGKFIVCLKVPLQYPMRYTILMKCDKWGCQWLTERLCVEDITVWSYTYCTNKQFQNLNFMAQSNENRKKKITMNPESMLDMVKSCDLKVRISFTVVVLFCICSRSNDHTSVWHQNYPVAPQKPEAHKFLNNQIKQP